MSIVLPALAVAFAAFCVWLAVRVFNRRERWATWTLVAALIVGCSIGGQIAFNAYVESVITDLRQGR